MKAVFMVLLFLPGNITYTQVPFWKDTGGPYPGTMSSIACDSGEYILARDHEWIFRSSDGGNSWNKIFRTNATTSFVVSGSIAFLCDLAGILRSTDTGLSWTPVYSLYDPERYFHSICITSQGHVLAALSDVYGPNNQIALSTDAGDNWDFVYPVPWIQALVAADQNRVYGVSAGYVFLSTDSGTHWTQQNSTPTRLPINSLAVGYDGLLFAGTDSGCVYRSTNNGQTWTLTNEGLMDIPVTTVHVARTGTVYAGTAGGGLYLSRNNGQEWSHVANGFTSMNVNTIASNASGNAFAGTSDGFYRSTNDGETWKQSNSGLASTSTLSFGFDPSQNAYAGTSVGLFQSLDHGESWIRNSLPGGFVNSVTFGANGIALAAQDIGMYRSADSGRTWTRISSFGAFNYSVLIHSNGFAFAGAQSGLYRSTDNGLTWDIVGPQAFSLASSTDHIFSGATEGRIYRSRDAGNTWTELETDSANGSVYSLAIHPGGYLFAATSQGGVLRSSDHGDMWSYVGFRDTTAWLAVNTDGILFAATLVGVYRSSDVGLRWEAINSGLTTLSTRSIGIDSRGYAYIGTNNGPVFVSLQPTTPVEQPYGLPARHYVLWQNYPNPFNPRTTIRYELPNACHVTLTVYNLLGRKVTTLVNGVEEPGYKSVEWNAAGVASGVYFYRLTAGDFVQTRKLLVLK